MSKEEMIKIMQTLSALEAAGLIRDLPVELLNRIDQAIAILERELVK